MAFVRDFGSGFEIGSNWPYETTGTSQFWSAIKKTGSYCWLVLNGAGHITMRPFATPPSEAYFSYWVACDNSNRTYGLRVYLSDGNYIQVMQSGGVLKAYVNDGVVATGTAVIPVTNTFYNVQVHIIVGDSGVIQVKYEGQSPLDIDYSGDTKPGAGTTISYARMDLLTAGVEHNFFVDDFSQGTGGWPGDIRYYPMPVASDADKNWSRSAGSDNYALIDEVPANDADYIYTETNLQQNTCHIGTFDDTNKTIVGITHWIRAKKDPSNAQTVKILEDQGGTQSLGDAIALTATFTDYCKVSNTDPNGDAWTKALLESCHYGEESQI